ncbi:putative tail protein [uncultured Mediterranean phage uvMED]|nr:putative tail protein [uncultured Mediterranean phage uvMED]
MALADSLRKVANKAIGKFGGDVTIQFVTTGDYDTTTGTVPSHAIGLENITVKGVLEDVNSSEVNDLVRGDDKKLTVAASALSAVPGVDDKVLISDVTHQVVRVETVEQANQAIVYQLFLRA